MTSPILPECAFHFRQGTIQSVLCQESPRLEPLMDWEHKRRGMLWIVTNGLIGHTELRCAGERLSRSQVEGKAWVGTTGDHEAKRT